MTDEEKVATKIYKVGRPSKVDAIDDAKFVQVLEERPRTIDEVAAVFNCSPDTIRRYVKKKYGQEATYEMCTRLISSPSARNKLLNVLWGKAEKGDPFAMRIWGKKLAPDMAWDEKQQIEVSRPLDETEKKIDEFFANKKSDTKSNMGQPD